MDTSRLNHIAGLIARKRSGGKLTGTEQQELEEWIRASRMNRESYDRIISGRGVIRLMELEKQIDTDRSFKKLTVRLKWRCWKRFCKSNQTSLLLFLPAFTIFATTVAPKH